MSVKLRRGRPLLNSTNLYITLYVFMSFLFLAYQKNLIRNQYAEIGGHLLVALLRNQDKATPGGSGSHLAEEGSHHTGFTTFDANSLEPGKSHTTTLVPR